MGNVFPKPRLNPVGPYSMFQAVSDPPASQLNSAFVPVTLTAKFNGLGQIVSLTMIA